MRLFQATWKDKRGRTRVSPRHTIEFKDHRGRLHRLAAFRSEKASKHFGQRLECLAEYVASGKAPDAALLAWADMLPQALRRKIGGLGLLAARSEHAGKTLEDHISDFKAALEARGDTAGYTQTLAVRVKAVIEATGALHWSDLDPEKVREYLVGRRRLPKYEADSDPRKVNRERISTATANHILAAVKQFCRWMIREGRATLSPVAYLEGFRGPAEHERRALTVPELAALLKAAGAGPPRFGVTGRERAWLYRVAAETGLRFKELASLTRASFDLEGERPSVAVGAGVTKNRQGDVLPLRPDTAAALAAFLGPRMPGAPAFRIRPWVQGIKLLGRDLDAAGIARRDDAGRVVDFHSLRHTFITNLSRAGVHPRTAQALARHSRIDLTMNVYSHSCLEDEASAVARLPDLAAAMAAVEVQATGTDGGGRTAAPSAAAPLDSAAQPAPSLLSAEKARATGTSDPGNSTGDLARSLARRVAERGVPVAARGRGRRTERAAGNIEKRAETIGKSADLPAFSEDSRWGGRGDSNPRPSGPQPDALSN